LLLTIAAELSQVKAPFALLVEVLPPQDRDVQLYSSVLVVLYVDNRLVDEVQSHQLPLVAVAKSHQADQLVQLYSSVLLLAALPLYHQYIAPSVCVHHHHWFQWLLAVFPQADQLVQSYSIDDFNAHHVYHAATIQAVLVPNQAEHSADIVLQDVHQADQVVLLNSSEVLLAEPETYHQAKTQADTFQNHAHQRLVADRLPVFAQVQAILF